ncbi:MAG: glutamate-1-semialdehyde 2,1-aminomutase [Acidobacteriota bacterium]
MGTRNEQLWAEAKQHLVGGVNSPVRSFSAVGGTPVFIERAEGARMISEEGREYVDFINSFGPLILGHAHEAVVEAICASARRGTSFAAPHRGEIEIAQQIKARIPQIEKLRLVNSGTEAVQSAVRLARGCTGRDLLLKFEGCYHGHVDSLLVNAGSGLATFGVASSAGIPEGTAKDTLVLPLDDDEGLERVFAEHGPRLAAAIIEPLPANNGLLVQRQEYLQLLRDLCSEHGALLIFDEVISGFRSVHGTVGRAIGIEPDLYTMGKILGGGLPVGAYGGPSEFMDQLAPLGPVYQAGTLSGNPLAVAAGSATLRYLEENSGWKQLDDLGDRLSERMDPVLSESPHPYQLVRHGSIFWLAYGADGPIRRADAFHPETAHVFRDLHHQMLQRGWMLAPSAYEVGFLSLAHTEEMIDRFAEAMAESLHAVEARA